jgi:hypothetical protein
MGELLDRLARLPRPPRANTEGLVEGTVEHARFAVEQCARSLVRALDGYLIIDQEPGDDEVGADETRRHAAALRAWLLRLDALTAAGSDNAPDQPLDTSRLTPTTPDDT